MDLSDRAVFWCDWRGREAEKQAVTEAEARAARERLIPLIERVAKLLATIPAEIQREGLTMPVLQTMLKGRRRGNCHPGELGEALKLLGILDGTSDRSGGIGKRYYE